MFELDKSIYLQWLFCFLTFCIVIVFGITRWRYLKTFSLKRKIISGILMFLSLILMTCSVDSFNYALKLLSGKLAVQPSWDVAAAWCDSVARLTANMTIALNVLVVCILIFKKVKAPKP